MAPEAAWRNFCQALAMALAERVHALALEVYAKRPAGVAPTAWLTDSTGVERMVDVSRNSPPQLLEIIRLKQTWRREPTIVIAPPTTPRSRRAAPAAADRAILAT